ncbi:serine/threonine protein phosphatase [Bradyrhizobium sp. AUGA SZCCT0177]|nr:serine/threonine protein phosphatase [Bradyrhizobium sp. AUGA SZCCT0177]
MEDLLTFAIGDVHGCFDKMEALLLACDEVRAGREVRYVFIGDYVDRGPDTRKVIDLLMRRQLSEGHRFICLRGNHDQMLITAASDRRSDRDLMNWWANGGEQTLDSYGVNDPSALPAEHLKWIKALPVRFADQKRLFVHAGIRPGTSIADQSEDDLLWIREPFLSFKADYGIFVVHGHTPTKSRLPDLRSHRLNLDTGACFGGELTAAAFLNQKAQPLFFVNSLGAVWQPQTDGLRRTD